MESRIARLESDVSYIKDALVDVKLDIRSINRNPKATSESIASLQKDVRALGEATVHLARKMEANLISKADLKATETTLIKWFVGTAIALTALVFVIARFVEFPSPLN